LVSKKTEKEIIPEELTSGEVWNILEFAQQMSGGSFYTGILTPALISSRMRDITLNPMAATENSLNDALKDPKNSELALQAFSQDFEIKSQIYRKLLAYLGNLLSFDLSYVCVNAKPSDYTTSAYSKDLDQIKLFFDKFDYKSEFSVVVKEMLRNEAYFCCPRFDGNRFVLQELPSSPTYTMITGRWDYGLLFSMSMLWFIQPGVNLSMYPKFFADKYNEFWKNNKGLAGYDPSADVLLGRGSSSYIYWQDIPVDVGWCWKFQPELITRLPRFVGLFSDLIQQPLMRELQKNINMSSAARIILGQIGTLKDTAAKVKDAFNINPKLLGDFLSLVKAAIGDSLKVAAAPLENMQAVSFPTANDVYSSFLKASLSTAGVSTSLLFDEGNNRTNAVQIQLSVNNDENDMKSLYPYFESFLRYQANKFTKKFKFKFMFEGTNFFNDRAQRLERAATLADRGIVLPQLFSSALSLNPFDFQRQLEEAQATNWVDKLTPIILAAQQSGKDGAGRPQTSDSKLGDAGEETRSSGANIDKGGKV
jgi:hypothetical protein